MVEKFAASFAAVLAIVLGIWTRVTFVRRSEIYGKDGKPVYRHASDCSVLQQSCNRAICLKIDEIKTGQGEIHSELREIRQFMGQVQQYMKDHDQ